MQLQITCSMIVPNYYCCYYPNYLVVVVDRSFMDTIDSIAVYGYPPIASSPPPPLT